MLRTVCGQLDLDIGIKPLQRPVGAARDAVFQHRRDTLVLIRDTLSKLTDEVRRKSEMIERSENNLFELRFVNVTVY